MADDSYLNNQFLVAMPGLEDENFRHSVTLLCEHSEKGALGLVVNRPTDLHLSEMLDQMGLVHDAIADDPIVFWGGPVQPERGFVVHRAPGGWDSTLQVDGDLYITTSRDVLGAIGRGEGPNEYLVLFGYPRSDRWTAAARLLGVDITHLASQAGHA